MMKSRASFENIYSLCMKPAKMATMRSLSGETLSEQRSESSKVGNVMDTSLQTNLCLNQGDVKTAYDIMFFM